MRIALGYRGKQLIWCGGLQIGLVVLLMGISIEFFRHRARERLGAHREKLIDSGERLVLEDAGLRSDPDALAAGERLLKAVARLPSERALSEELMTLPMRFVAPGEALVGWRQDATQTVASRSC